jgi:hypothetical protein
MMPIGIVWTDTKSNLQFHSNIGVNFFLSQESPPASPIGPVAYVSGSKGGITNWSAAMKPKGAPPSYYSRGPRIQFSNGWTWFQEKSLEPGKVR